MTKTTKTTKTTTAKFWIARAKKIAVARARNAKKGMTERQRRAARKLQLAKLAKKTATKKAA